MLYLATLNGETIPQSLPTIRDNIAFPFKVQCNSASNELVKQGTVICIVGFKMGKYVTSDGLHVLGDDIAWCLQG